MAAFKKWVIMSVPAMVLQVTGLIFFILGFFPVKPSLKDMSGIESLHPGCFNHSKTGLASDELSRFKEKLQISLHYDRAVVMVIDGLPAEFVVGRDGRHPPRELTEAMPFTQSLLSQNKAKGFHVKAAPPTVTMPRLKAMTSGAIAGFLDVAFNFNTQALLDDNIIGQLKRLGWRMVLHGDETWLRLFPNSFFRHDGVSSFYVKDTVQVDRNVTRHLDEEMELLDWDLLVLHYLGLDHVGHLGGRSSPLMPSKLKEMDDVIRRLYESLVRKHDTLLVIVSDHGMLHNGNHGGASYEETDALALFVRRQQFTKFMSSVNNWEHLQVDLVPTLALLLGVPIPKNSVGALMPELFDILNGEEIVRALELNAWQIMRLLSVRSPSSPCLVSICSGKETIDISSENNHNNDILNLCNLFNEAKTLHNKWKHPTCNKRDHECALIEWKAVSMSYQIFLRAASIWLSKGTTEKNRLFVSVGVVLMTISAVIFIGVSFWTKKEASYLSMNQEECNSMKLEHGLAIFGVCGHALSFNSSSFVEEEQFTLHFLVVTMWWCFLRGTFQQRITSNIKESFRNTISNKESWLLSPKCEDGGTVYGKEVQRMAPSTIDRKKKITEVASITIVLITARLIRAWNRGGVNWAHLPDGAKWLDQADRSFLFVAQITSLVAVHFICLWLVLERKLPTLIRRFVIGSLLSTFVLIVCYKLRAKDGAVALVDHFSIKLAQLIYTVLGITALLVVVMTPWIVYSRTMDKKGFNAQECNLCLNYIGKVLVSCWCLLQLLLQQPVNSVPWSLLLVQLIFCLMFLRDVSSRYCLWLKILTLYWMGASGHFGMGNTNTLATVDVAGAYIGLSEHSIFLSGVLAFMITYAAPLLYMLGVPLVVSFINTDNRLPRETQAQQWLLSTVALPSSVMLTLSSVILLVFTIVMLFMQGHLFIWSVFSPKYIYVCFTIVSTYVGVSINTIISLYTFIVAGKSGR